MSQGENVVFVAATENRKKYGGIWRGGRFYTLNFHRVVLNDIELERVTKDRNLIVKTKLSKKESFEEGTIGAGTSFPNAAKPIDRYRKQASDEDDEETTSTPKRSRKKKSSIEDRLEKMDSKNVKDESEDDALPDGIADDDSE